jgi:hypothetical protein
MAVTQAKFTTFCKELLHKFYDDQSKGFVTNTTYYVADNETASLSKTFFFTW